MSRGSNANALNARTLSALSVERGLCGVAMQRMTTFGAMRMMIALLALAFCAPLRAAVQLAPLIVDTPGNIASFGEDEHGEMLVVDLRGTVSRLTAVGSCRYAIAPSRATFAKAGGEGSIAVTTDSECPWKAATDDGWITLGDSAGGSGSGTITYAVAPYAGKPKTRIGAIVIAGMTFTITQNRLRLLVRGGK